MAVPHAAETLLSEASLVTDLVFTDMVSGLFGASSYLLHGRPTPRSRIHARVPTLRTWKKYKISMWLRNNPLILHTASTQLRLDGLLHPLFANHASLFLCQWKQRKVTQSFHGLGLAQIRCECLGTPKTDAGNEVPQTSEGFEKLVAAEEIFRMSEPQELNQHMHVQGLSHLRLHDSEISSNMTEDSWNLMSGNVIGSRAGFVSAVEESADHQAHRPMKTTSGHHRVAYDECMKTTRVLV
jgi:hypothetical protein